MPSITNDAPLCHHLQHKILTPSQLARDRYLAVLAHWPKDPLRPSCQLQDVLRKRLDEQNKFPGVSTGNPKDEQAQVNALASLLGNRYKTNYAPWGEMGTNLYSPKSKPTYYKELMEDLEQAPTRSWLQRIGKRLGGMIRFS